MQKAIDETKRRREIQEKYNFEHNIIPKTISKEIRDLISNVVVQWKTGIVFRSNGGCTFNIPTNYTKTNSTQIDAQIHSVIWFHEKAPALARWATTHNARYYWTNNRTVWTCYPNWETGTNPSVCQPKNFRYYDELDTHEWECLNYRIFWCGDWLLNWYNWGTSYNNIDWTLVEQCDPNLPSSIPSGKRCNTTTCILEDITPTEYCWDEIINQESEDCDPGSSNFWNGCSSNCKLMTPSCTFTVNPSQWYIPLTTTISGTTNARWGRIVTYIFEMDKVLEMDGMVFHDEIILIIHFN